jgi:hypothetical protein
MGDSDPDRWAAALDVVADGPSGTLLMGHGRPAGREWLRTFQSYLTDVVIETTRRATRSRDADEVAREVRASLADRYRTAFDREAGRYRPWDALVLRNVRHVYGLLNAYEQGVEDVASRP